jgi:hypothetical protein
MLRDILQLRGSESASMLDRRKLPRLILPIHLLVLKNFSQNCVSFAYGDGIADLVGMLRS